MECIQCWPGPIKKTTYFGRGVGGGRGYSRGSRVGIGGGCVRGMCPLLYCARVDIGIDWFLTPPPPKKINK